MRLDHQYLTAVTELDSKSVGIDSVIRAIALRARKCQRYGAHSIHETTGLIWAEIIGMGQLAQQALQSYA